MTETQQPVTTTRPAPLLKPAEAARRLNVTIDTLARWARTGRINAATLPSGHHRYPATGALALPATTQETR